MFISVIYLKQFPSSIGYADDLALLFANKNWNTVKLTLGEDHDKAASNLEKWRLKLSKSKTTASAFHLNTSEANRQLAINLEGTPCPTPRLLYLGVKLDGQLNFRQHLKDLCKSNVQQQFTSTPCWISMECWHTPFEQVLWQ